MKFWFSLALFNNGDTHQQTVQRDSRLVEQKKKRVNFDIFKHTFRSVGGLINANEISSLEKKALFQNSDCMNRA